MKRTLYVFAVLFIAFNLSSCTEAFDDLNVEATKGEEDLELHAPD